MVAAAVLFCGAFRGRWAQPKVLGGVAAAAVRRRRGTMKLSVDLQKRLSANFALDVKFSIPAGVTILFGASGSGKTTLLRCVAGLLRPDSGQIKIGDQILFDSDTRVDVPVRERKIGFLFQNLALFPHLSVAKKIGRAHV